MGKKKPEPWTPDVLSEQLAKIQQSPAPAELVGLLEATYSAPAMADLLARLLGAVVLLERYAGIPVDSDANTVQARMEAGAAIAEVMRAITRREMNRSQPEPSDEPGIKSFKQPQTALITAMANEWLEQGKAPDTLAQRVIGISAERVRSKTREHLEAVRKSTANAGGNKGAVEAEKKLEELKELCRADPSILALTNEKAAEELAKQARKAGIKRMGAAHLERNIISILRESLKT